MKKYLFLLSFFLFTLFATSQTQQGYVKTRGRMNATGTVTAGVRLSGATLRIKNSSSIISGNKGTFSFAVPSNTFCITGVQKHGYVLCDNDILNNVYKYSVNPFVVVMETPENNTADRLAAERKIRRTLERQLREKEDEIEALKAQQKITDAEYHRQLQELYAQQSKNDNLISEMADRYSSMDFDQLDEFQRQVAFFIQNGELVRADSLLNTKGSMADRSAELDRMDAIIKADAEDLAKRQEAHNRSVELKARNLADFAADCYSRYEICKLQHKNDSAAYWLELRASKDTTNGEWQVDCGSFILDYLANYTLAQTYMERLLSMVINDPDSSDAVRGASLANLADVYLKSGRIDDAIRMYTEALSYHDRDSEAYIAVSVGLANCYEYLTENKKAYDYLSEAYAIYEQKNYSTPKLLLRIYNELATNLCKIGKFEEAQKYFDCSIELAENDSEIDQPRQIVAYFEAASFYKTINKYEHSEILYLKALEVCQLIYDDRHPMLSSIYNGLGVLYHSLSDYDKALVYLQKSKDCLSGTMPSEHYAQICSNIASLYLHEGKLNLSEQYEMEAYNTRKKIFGEDSPAMFDQYNALCALYCEKGEYEDALRFVEKAIDIRKRESGEMHPSFVASYSFVGGINMRLGKLEDALKWFELTLDVAKHYYGNEHTQTADAYNNLGGVNMYLERYDEAVEMLKESLRIHIAVYGEKHASVAADYNGIAQTYMAMMRYKEAIANFEKAIEIRKKVFGENSIKLKSLYEFMIQIYKILGDSENAKIYEDLLNGINV